MCEGLVRVVVYFVCEGLAGGSVKGRECIYLHNIVIGCVPSL